MLHVAELLPLTGYVRGGCSPVGMKKQFPTVFHDSARHYDRIAVSAGKIGLQVLAAPAISAAWWEAGSRMSSSKSGRAESENIPFTER